MTEPEQSFPAESGPSGAEFAQLSVPGAGQVANPDVPRPESGEKVLATHEPHTFHASPDHVITPGGTVVPSDKAEEYIALAQRNGVHVYEKEG